MKRKVKKRPIVILLIIIALVGILFIVNNKPKLQDNKVKKVVKDETRNDKDTKEEALKEGEELVEKTSKGYRVTKLNNIYYVDGIMIVNKSYPLPSTYQPQDPYKEITSDYLYGGDYIENSVMEAYLKMKEDASKEGLNLRISSGYRSYKVQIDLYNNYVSRDGKESADKYSARPGHSEHQSGLCFDLNGTNANFIETKEGKWLNDNCYKYGFILRFPSGSEDKTGYMYEGWHFRYVGEELANKLYNNGNWISLEEYYGLTSVYGD